jgi:hypothetical protein
MGFHRKYTFLLQYALSSLADNSIALLRRQIYGKDKVVRADLEQALRTGGDDTPEYAQLLGDVAVDILVNQANPPQYVSQTGADWLVAQIDANPLPYRVEIRLLTANMRSACRPRSRASAS